MTDVDLIHIYEDPGDNENNKSYIRFKNKINDKNDSNSLAVASSAANVFNFNSLVPSLQNDNTSDVINSFNNNNNNSKSSNQNINDSNERNELSSINTTNAFDHLSRQYSIAYSSRSQSIVRNRYNNNNNNNNNNASNNLNIMNTSNFRTTANNSINIEDSSSINSTSVNYNANEPIIIRGDGNVTIFGIFNRFSKEFPPKLSAKLAPEEYRDTITKVNVILKKELSNSLKWLIFGSICCCCTFGCSLLPVFYINKKAKLTINKLLSIENERIYKKLGIKWRLAKQKLNSGSLLEYVIIIDLMPSLLIYEPD